MTVLMKAVLGEYLDSRVRGEWNKLHNNELHKLVSSENIISVIKSVRTKWGGGGICHTHGRDNVCTPAQLSQTV